MFRRAGFATAVLIAVVAAGCGNARSPSSGGGATMGAPAQSASVDINSFKYMPVTIAVKKGGHVRWTNSDAAAHTATADDRSFDTQTIDRGKSRMVTFTSAGSFPYHCDFHPFMKATVVVR